jgi:hypothetical protein
MKRSHSLILSLCCALITGAVAAQPGQGNNAPANTSPAAAPARAQWTVLVYMNGHNNLEDDIPVNFRQMAAVGSTAQVNIIAQVAKLGNGTGGQPWRDKVFRYRISQNMMFSPTTAIATLGRTDMGDPATLKDFLKWGATNYPADHYMLVMWGHGQGYRMEMLTVGLQHRLNVLQGMDARALPGDLHAFTAAHAHIDGIAPIHAPTSAVTAPATAHLNLNLLSGSTPSVSPYRTVSSDDVFGSKLYMSDLQAVLRDETTNDANFHGKLALLGFDACLMAMIENAYAFRDVAQIMVASQDLDPGAGWSYRPWLSALTQQPNSDPATIGKSIVDSFAAAYGDVDGTTTMSEIDLSKANTLALATSQLAQTMIAALPGALADISAARAGCPYYAPDPFSDGHDYFYHIDLGCFVDGLANAHDAALKSAAAQTRHDLKAAVLRSYAGSDRVSFGSNGLCIYFPATLSEFNGDLYAENGYVKANLIHPVEFVHTLSWSDFLSAYYASVSATRAPPSAARAQSF